MKLDNAIRAQYKRALLQAGQTTAGLSDDDLQAAFYALSGNVIHSQEPTAIDQAPVEPVKPVKVKKPVKKPIVEQPAPTESTQSIELPNGSAITINMVAGATLNITIKAA